jgi:hypothetical protein
MTIGSGFFKNIHAPIAGHQHRARCHRHRHSGIRYLSLVPERSIPVPKWVRASAFFYIPVPDLPHAGQSGI